SRVGRGSGLARRRRPRAARLAARGRARAEARRIPRGGGARVRRILAASRHVLPARRRGGAPAYLLQCRALSRRRRGPQARPPRARRGHAAGARQRTRAARRERAREDVMPKDYKDAPATRGDTRLSHPLLLGMIIGLLLGIVISLAVALWLNRLANPFVEKGKQVEPLPKIGPVQPPPPAEAAKAAEQAAKGKAPEKGAKDRPRFEFYQILPGDREVTDREVKAAVPKA